MPLGHGLRSFGQGKDGLGNLSLQRPGNQIGDQQGSHNDQQGDSAVESKPFIHGTHIGSEIERAETFAILYDLLKAGEVRLLETITVLSRRGRKSFGRDVQRILREQLSVL